jgi:hypothetical protein
MNLAKWILTAGCALALGVPHAWPQQPPKQPDIRLDVSKNKVVERGPARVVANSAPVAPPKLDVSKELVIEKPTKALATARAATTDTNNPTVEPGKVKWHKTVADARAAAEKSGRPVLVFHMMGQLDKQFC